MKHAAAKFIPKLRNFAFFDQKKNRYYVLATAFTRLGSMWLFPIPKTGKPHVCPCEPKVMRKCIISKVYNFEKGTKPILMNIQIFFEKTKMATFFLSPELLYRTFWKLLSMLKKKLTHNLGALIPIYLSIKKIFASALRFLETNAIHHKMNRI